MWCYAGGEGRQNKLADIDKCERKAEEMLQQATEVPLSMVGMPLVSIIFFTAYALWDA